MPDLPPQPVRLHLYAGPVIAVPAPKVVVEALREVTIESGSGDTQSGFELVFDVPKKSPLTTLFLLSGGASVPLLRIVIAVTVGGSTEVLADGVMTHHEIQTEGATATLRVKGKDLSAVMDRLRVREIARRAGRLRVLPRPRPGAWDEPRVLGAGDPGRSSAAGPERRLRRAA